MQEKRYKREDNKDSYQDLRYRMEQEYHLFKYEILSKTRKEIYERCGEIRFYECLHEYFLYQENKDTKEEFLKKALETKNIYWELWNLYLKHEYLEVSTWEQIEEILSLYIYNHSKNEQVSIK